MVAPIGRNGKQGDIYAWIGELQGRREDDEAKRLLYVAATRARRELHLLGTATLKKNGQELTPGSSGSLLGIAWTALQPDFERAREEQAPAGDPAPLQAEFSFPPASPTIQLHRLPADWKPPESRRPARGSGKKSGSHRAAPWLASGARIRHRRACAARRYDTLTRHRGGRSFAIVLDELRSWRPRAMAMLRSAGLPRAEAEPQAAEVVRALQGVLQDAKGRWILGARAGAQTETSWSGWVGFGGSRSRTHPARRSHLSRRSNPLLHRRNTLMDCGLQDGSPRRFWPGCLSRKRKGKVSASAGSLCRRHAQGSRRKPAATAGPLLPALDQAGVVVKKSKLFSPLIYPKTAPNPQ